MKSLKNAFQEAYLQLLHQHPPTQVSVKQIVLVANTSRSSFYTHFANREQLHLYVKQQIHREFFMHYEIKNPHEFSSTTTLNLCQHIIKYRSYYQHALQNTLDFHHLAIELSNYLMYVYNDLDYAIFASFGTIGFLKNWVEHDFLISPSEAAEKLMKIGFTNWASKVNI